MGTLRSSCLAVVVPLMVVLSGCGGGGDGSAQQTVTPGGIPDDTFGTAGSAITDMHNNTDAGSAVAIQNDGKLVVVGRAYNGSNYDFGIVRYHPDGTLDDTFGTNGRVLTDFNGDIDEAYGVAIQPGPQGQQKIVVVGDAASGGHLSFGVARYDASGSLDTTFNTTGKVITNMNTGGTDTAYGVVIQADGKIVAVGTTGDSHRQFALARYTPGGTLDTTFGTNGISLTDAELIVNGDHTGKAIAHDVALQSDQKIVVAGELYNYGNPQMVVARFKTDGSLDPTFDVDGIAARKVENASRAYGVAIQGDGKIVLAGYANQLASPNPNMFAVLRFTGAGSLDTTFSVDGIATTAIGASDDRAQDLAIQSDGRIVAVGYATVGGNQQFAFARYMRDGSLDTSFGSSGTLTMALGNGKSSACSVAIQPDNGRIVAAGTAHQSGDDYALARLLP
jgi:uncharacterized delta-60 repeat protein